MLRRMISRSVLAAGSLAAVLCLSAAAQTTGTPAQPLPTQQNLGGPAPQQAPAKAPTGGLEPGAPPLQLQSLTPEPHTLTPAEEARLKQERAYQQAIRVATLEARWGLTMSTPGVSASLVEVGHTKLPSGETMLTYQITGTGFRTGEKLSLIDWPLGEGMKAVMGDIVINAKGTAVCGVAAAPASSPTKTAGEAPSAAGATTSSSAPPSLSAPAPQMGSAAPAKKATTPSCGETMQLNQPVEIRTTAGAAQAIRVALVGEDHSNGAATEAVPYPIEDTDQGCSLEVLRVMKNADLVVVQGSGFPVKSTVRVDTLTNGRTNMLEAHTDAAGRMALAILPARQGKPSGTTTVSYVGMVHAPSLKAPTEPAAPDPSCRPMVTFPWGQGAYPPK